MIVTNSSNAVFNPVCKNMTQAVKTTTTKEETCQALFDLKACLTQKEGFFKNKEILTNRPANPGQLARVESKLDQVTKAINLLGCKKS